MKYPFPASSLDYRREASSDRISQRLSRVCENKRAIVQRERQLMSEGPISVLWILQIRRQRLIRCLFKKPQVSIAAAAAIYVPRTRRARPHRPPARILLSFSSFFGFFTPPTLCGILLAFASILPSFQQNTRIHAIRFAFDGAHSAPLGNAVSHNSIIRERPNSERDLPLGIRQYRNTASGTREMRVGFSLFDV